MAQLNAGITHEAAFNLLSEHNKDPFHIEHAETVEQTMRYFEMCIRDRPRGC